MSYMPYPVSETCIMCVVCVCVCACVCLHTSIQHHLITIDILPVFSSSLIKQLSFETRNLLEHI